MRAIPALLLLFLLICVPPPPCPAQSAPEAPAENRTGHASGIRPLSLAESFALARRKSQNVALNVEQVVQARARFIQALGVALPQVSYSDDETWQDPGTGTTSPTGGFFAGERRVSSRSFVFSQTLFSGFREFAAISGSRTEREQRRAELRRALETLFIDVSDAFYLLAQQREEIRVLEMTRTVLRNRLEDLGQREEIGRSRPSESASVRAQLFSLEAEIEQAHAGETTARELLEYLTGRPVGELLDQPPPEEKVAPVEDYTLMALTRPDVRAARLAVEVAQKNVLLAKADLVPRFNVQYNRFTRRTAVPGSEWSTILTVEVPIFELNSYGSVMEARSRARAEELRLSALQDSAVLEVRQAYVRYRRALSRREALRKALEAAEVNYRLQRQDYELNLVDNLEVLTALQSLYQAHRNYVSALYESRRSYWQLRSAAGELPMIKD